MAFYKDGETMYSGRFAKIVIRYVTGGRYPQFYCEVVLLADNCTVAVTRDYYDAGSAYAAGMNAYGDSKAF